MTRLVLVESPFRGETVRNIAYARRCVRDCLERGEVPMAPHLVYTQPGILDDEIPNQREQGISAGLQWLRVVDASVVYVDFGITEGMKRGMEAAQGRGLPVEVRTIGTGGL